jgi:hypothetical protein
MNQINDATKRSIFRWIHIIFGIPIIGYVYSPFEELPNYAPVVRFVALPVLRSRECLSGTQWHTAKKSFPIASI